MAADLAQAMAIEFEVAKSMRREEGIRKKGNGKKGKKKKKRKEKKEIRKKKVGTD